MEADKENHDNTAEGETLETEKLKRQLHKEHEMYLRALADFDNYRRRSERERVNAAVVRERKLLFSLLEILDSFELALRSLGNADPSVAEGMQVIQRKLLGLLEGHGIRPMASLGESFNPQYHEAIGSVESHEHESGIIIDELQRGYRWNNEVFRPARVLVVK
jgi:molecular chaperone GrpE